jgi:hypothetical protein
MPLVQQDWRRMFGCTANRDGGLLPAARDGLYSKGSH